jgi:ABC-type Fe3+/spermidine/putrescine transport system ATPase subunit
VVGAGADAADLRLDCGVTVRVASAGARTGERVHAVVRPEKLELRLAGADADSGRPSVEGVIESALYLGTATQVVVRLKDGTAMTVLVPNTDEAARQRMPGAGARVVLSWASEHIHLVRAAEGAAPEARETAAAAA